MASEKKNSHFDIFCGIFERFRVAANGAPEALSRATTAAIRTVFAAACATVLASCAGDGSMPEEKNLDPNAVQLAPEEIPTSGTPVGEILQAGFVESRPSIGGTLVEPTEIKITDLNGKNETFSLDTGSFNVVGSKTNAPCYRITPIETASGAIDPYLNGVSVGFRRGDLAPDELARCYELMQPQQ